ncbi:15775_t:CDS:2 [Acaulospora morrowiae]|uniref:15775_t:CDS:1 n=1 Tax=Acaulospora morrowiae TaxID=94023 RepID=A0A9N8ZSY6_9GLOM|nr:15775_t:CDS:2 [Acaulospora morrowiae]
MIQTNVPHLHVSASVTLHTANGDGGYEMYTFIATFESFPPPSETSSYMIFRFNDKDHGIICGYINSNGLDFIDRVKDIISVESTGHIDENMDEENLDPSIFEDTEGSAILLNYTHLDYVVCRVDDNSELTLICYIGEEVLNLLKERELVRKHICRDCKKLYKYPCHLRYHMQVHTNERLECRVEGCKKSYTLEVNRRRHEKSHVPNQN